MNRILISGDFFISDEFANCEFVDNYMADFFTNADYVITNLESPVTKNDAKNKILKTGPHLRTSKYNILSSLKKLNTSLVTLANNHIMDYGKVGYYDTIKFCKENNIDYVGVGKNIKEANTAKRLLIGRTKISLINFAENEWASATCDSAGANPMDLIDNIELIKNEKNYSDIVFVIVHGGHEFYSLPSPRMQKQYRYYIDNGADLVVGHHPHCFSGYELYNNKSIFYSLGNFLFTIPSKKDDWYKGIVLQITIDKNKNIKTLPIFIKQSRNNFKLNFVKGTQLEDMNYQFLKLSNIICNQKELNNKWNEFVLSKKNSMLRIWSMKIYLKNRLLRAVLKRLGFKLRSNRTQTIFLNNLRCEAHNEISQAVIKNDIDRNRNCQN